MLTSGSPALEATQIAESQAASFEGTSTPEAEEVSAQVQASVA